jgi:hypothetical protein
LTRGSSERAIVSTSGSSGMRLLYKKGSNLNFSTFFGFSPRTELAESGKVEV